MMANSDYNHEYWKLIKDLEKKLKEEESRDAFHISKNDFETF